MSNRAYDTLKIISLIIAPMITLVAAIMSIWGIKHAAEVTATLVAIDTALGAIVTTLSTLYAPSTGRHAK